MVEELHTLEQVYEHMLQRAPENAMEPRMAPMERMMELLGEPHRSAPVIHLTGTNGKTSTARMVESVLRAYGLRTGRYTSPHLVSFTERISVDGSPVDADTVVRVWNEIAPLVEFCDSELRAAGEPRLTYFEAVTVLGFAVFADAPVDVMILEVGLGGITDATNVADAQVAVVTPISLDHTDLLGDTVGEIAQEKVGIVKDGSYLVSAAQEPEAAQVLLDGARAHGSSFAFENIDFGVTARSIAVGGQQVSVKGIAGEYPDLFLPLHGPHQAENLAVAIAALEAFLGGGLTELKPDLLQDGLTRVTSPGRMEVLQTGPTLVIDAAHNPAGMEVTAATLRESFNFTSLGLVVGVLREKDAFGLLEALFQHFGDQVQHLALTQSDSPRAIPAEELADIAEDAGWDPDVLHATPAVTDAIRWAVEGVREADAELRAEGAPLTEGTGGPGVLVTGSITLVGQVRGLLGPDDLHADDEDAEAAAVAAAAIIEDHDDLAQFFAADGDDGDEGDEPHDEDTDETDGPTGA